MVISYEEFFQMARKLPVAALERSKAVLQRRRKLEDMLPILQKKINEASNVRSSIQSKKQALQNYRAKRDGNADYSTWYDDSKWKQITVPQGTYTTTCMYCQRTCHDDCAYSNDDEKRNCCVMDGNGKCEVCGCHWTRHQNTPYRWEYVVDKGYRPNEQMKAIYDQAVRDAGSCEAAIGNLRSQFEDQWQQAYKHLQQYRAHLEELNHIAMKPQKTTAVDYLEHLIQVQEQTKPAGYQEKVKFYRQALEMEKLASELGTVKGEAEAKKLITKWFGEID